MDSIEDTSYMEAMGVAQRVDIVAKQLLEAQATLGKVDSSSEASTTANRKLALLAKRKALSQSTSQPSSPATPRRGSPSLRKANLDGGRGTASPITLPRTAASPNVSQVLPGYRPRGLDSPRPRTQHVDTRKHQQVEETPAGKSPQRGTSAAVFAPISVAADPLASNPSGKDDGAPSLQVKPISAKPSPIVPGYQFSFPSANGGSVSHAAGSPGGFAGLTSSTKDGKPAWGSTAPTTGFSFGGAGAAKPLFSSPEKSKGTSGAAGGDTGKGPEEEEEGEAGGDFEPVVQLPDAIDVVTGEEDDEVVFEHRAKLFRWGKTNEGESWKERAVGLARLLFVEGSRRARFVMRRDQVKKVAANHWVTADMKLEPMASSDRSFAWVATDASDDEGPEVHKFAIRFKTKETAESFRAAFKEAQTRSKAAPELSAASPERLAALREAASVAKAEAAKLSAEATAAAGVGGGQKLSMADLAAQNAGKGKFSFGGGVGAASSVGTAAQSQSSAKNETARPPVALPTFRFSSSNPSVPNSSSPEAATSLPGASSPFTFQFKEAGVAKAPPSFSFSKAATPAPKAASVLPAAARPDLLGLKGAVGVPDGSTPLSLSAVPSDGGRPTSTTLSRRSSRGAPPPLVVPGMRDALPLSTSPRASFPFARREEQHEEQTRLEARADEDAEALDENSGDDEEGNDEEGDDNDWDTYEDESEASDNEINDE